MKFLTETKIGYIKLRDLTIVLLVTAIAGGVLALPMHEALQAAVAGVAIVGATLLVLFTIGLAAYFYGERIPE